MLPVTLWSSENAYACINLEEAVKINTALHVYMYMVQNILVWPRTLMACMCFLDLKMQYQK